MEYLSVNTGNLSRICKCAGYLSINAGYLSINAVNLSTVCKCAGYLSVNAGNLSTVYANVWDIYLKMRDIYL